MADSLPCYFCKGKVSQNLMLVQELLLYTFNKNSYFSIPDFDLNKQCCTFQKTSYSYQYQHFYICNTCDMAGVCIVCSKVCHSRHDVIYDGYMKSYKGCCCGRRGNKSCKALNPRSSSPNLNNVEQEVTSSSPLLPRQGKYYIFDNM